LFATPIERSTRLVDGSSFEQEPRDGLPVVGALGFGLGDLVELAPLAELIVLELDQEPGDLVTESCS
jgi:hypothetical protein